MARRMRRNGGQWKVLLFVRSVNSTKDFEVRSERGVIPTDRWRSGNYPQSHSVPVESLDEGVSCALSMLEHEMYNTAYIVTPSGHPVASMDYDGDRMRLYTLTTPLVDGDRHSAREWATMAYETELRVYHRDGRGWTADAAVRVSPHKFEPDFTWWRVDDLEFDIWSHEGVALSFLNATEARGSRPRWVVNRLFEENDYVWIELTQNLFARPIPEDQ